MPSAPAASSTLYPSEFAIGPTYRIEYASFSIVACDAPITAAKVLVTLDASLASIPNWFSVEITTSEVKARSDCVAAARSRVARIESAIWSTL